MEEGCTNLCTYSTRFKDAGIAIRYSRKYINISILQGLENGLERIGGRVLSYNMNQFRTKITKIKVPTFRTPGIRMSSCWTPMPARSPISFKRPRPFFRNIRGQLFENTKNAGFSMQGPYSSWMCLVPASLRCTSTVLLESILDCSDSCRFNHACLDHWKISSRF